jgi:hypothetical protein
MITFKQFITEKAMHGGSFANSMKKLGDQVKLGLEVEVLVPQASALFVKGSTYKSTWKGTAQNVAKALGSKLGGVKFNVAIGAAGGVDEWKLYHDESIKDSDERTFEKHGAAGVEIVTPPLSLRSGLSVLDTILPFISEHGLETNKSTSLHINLSIPDIAKRIDPVKLVLFMGDQHILKTFDRLSNNFTRSQLQVMVDELEVSGELPETLDDIKKAAEAGLAATGKHFSVNLSKLYSGYLEFRAVGGPGYHTRVEEIKRVIGRLVVAIDIASDPEAEKREYAKKLVKLLSKTGVAKDEQAKSELSVQDRKDRLK